MDGNDFVPAEKSLKKYSVHVPNCKNTFVASKFLYLPDNQTEKV